MIYPFVSVIIPVYHDSCQLKRCLEALNCQSYPLHRFEVIVINNDPGDSETYSMKFTKARLLTQPKAGSYAARNLGINVAQGDVVAFTDSDCVPHKDWLLNSVDALLNGAERIAGRITLLFDSDILSLAEIYEYKFAFPQAKYAKMGFGATANMITWRKYFDQIGFFDENLFSGGDYEWGMRASRAGISISYACNVSVGHVARKCLGEIIRKSRRVEGGHAMLSGMKLIPADLINFFRCLMPPIKLLLDKNLIQGVSPKEWICLVLFSWYLRMDRSAIRILLKAGFFKPSRT